MLEGKAQVAKTQEDDKTPQNGGGVADGVQLPQAATGLPNPGEFHPDRRGDRHVEMIPDTIDEKPDHHHPVRRGGEANQQGSHCAEEH